MRKNDEGEVIVKRYYDRLTDETVVPLCRRKTANFYRAQYEAALGPDKGEDFFEFTARYKELADDYLENYAGAFACEANFLIALNNAGLIQDAESVDQFFQLHEFVESLPHKANAKLVGGL